MKAAKTAFDAAGLEFAEAEYYFDTLRARSEGDAAAREAATAATELAERTRREAENTTLKDAYDAGVALIATKTTVIATL